MNEKTLNNAKGRELRRFHQAVDKVIDQLQTEKYEQTRDHGEYRQYVAVCTFVKNLTRAVDLLSDKLPALFEQEGERTKWEVYLSGLRKLCRDLPDSYLFRFVLPLYGLDDFQAKVVSYADRWLDGLHAAHRFFAEAERYLGHLERGEQIAAEYQAAAGEDLARLYASLKTWEGEREMGAFFEAVAEFTDTTLEVLVVGPLQLYLLLGRDTCMLIFKALSVGRLSDLREGEAEYAELLGLHDFVHGLVERSATLGLLREMSVRVGKVYAQSLREEETRLRGQLPTDDMKRSFIRRYEAGVLFAQQRED